MQWSWDKYQVSSKVMVFNIIENKLIQITWGEPKTSVDFIFEEISPEQTYLKIRNYDISLQGSELIQFIIDATGGFTTVLDGLKAYFGTWNRTSNWLKTNFHHFNGDLKSGLCLMSYDEPS